MHSLRSAVVIAAFAFGLSAGPAAAQRPYTTPDAAAQAFFEAVLSGEAGALVPVLGPDWRRLVPVDSVDREDVYDFLAAWAQQHKTILETPERAVLAAGVGDWTLPIPLVKSEAGWRFDTRAGADLMRSRRIGRNELAAMQAALAYVDAQKEYALQDRDGLGVRAYARRFVSTPGRRDGLFWPDETGQDVSPLGPLYAGGRAGDGYHGYGFKILDSQGPHASGGAFDYVIGGRMRGGFALIAWPKRYGEAGVMSFLVNHDGVVFEKDLGPATEAAAGAMTRFDPGSGWRKAPSSGD